ncbi:MAG: FtsW/RodA/SpoVE family cell cycle protein [Lachnospiraceae bacterium]|nr:FtsW/RodA/SpoVE family cell cycle protein [Lachnospiraceae bacterium]
MILYTVECFMVFLHKDEEERKGIYIRQNILMFAFHFCSFMVICFETGKISYLLFYAIQQMVLYMAVVLYKWLYPKTNGLIVNNMCMLMSISFVILTRLDYSKAVKQFMIGSTSLVVALIIPFFIRNIKLLKNLKWVYAVAGILLLGVVYILGSTTYGSKISYSIGGLSFQPAEFVKLIFVFFVASALYQSHSITEVLFTSIVAAVHVGIQVLNKDLGSALIFFVIYLFMVFVATKNIIYLALGLSAGAGAAVFAYHFFSHIQVRVQAFIDPWSVIDSAGYQITQSLFAISSAGMWGLGLFQGTPNTIPFVEDDFIFSAIVEEMGIIFGICLLLVCVSIFIMIMIISSDLGNGFYGLIAFGLGICYIFQVFLTVGGGTKFIPLTGVTLPMVSYGGSSILTTLVMFAIIEGLYMIREDEAAKAKKRREELIRKKKEKRRKEKLRKKKLREKRASEEYYEDDILAYEDDSYEYKDEKPARKKASHVNKDARPPYSKTAHTYEEVKYKHEVDLYEYEEDPYDYDPDRQGYDGDIHAYEEDPQAEDDDIDIRVSNDFELEDYTTIYYNEEEHEEEQRRKEKKKKKI